MGEDQGSMMVALLELFAGLGIGLCCGIFLEKTISSLMQHKKRDNINYCIIKTRARLWDLYSLLRCDGELEKIHHAEWKELLRAMENVMAWDKEILDR
jgi:hypothetical protein